MKAVVTETGDNYEKVRSAIKIDNYSYENQSDVRSFCLSCALYENGSFWYR